jgi:putative membrane protein
MRNRKSQHNRWLLSTACGLSLFAVSGTAALAQNVPTQDATAPQGPGAATEVIQLKPGQESGTPTVLPADTSGNPNASTRDAHFVWRASAANQAEVAFGRLAEQRGQSPNEQNFGRMLEMDHAQSEAQLSTIAEPLMLKTSPGLSPMQTSLYQQLQTVPADQFDATFNQVMIQAHQVAIGFYQTEVTSGENLQLRTYAQQTLPALQQHLALAEQLSRMPVQGPAMAMTPPPAPGMTPPPVEVPPPSSVVNAQVSGNPDNSADQLNARVLQFNSQS